jgi:hypothetical protein
MYLTDVTQHADSNKLGSGVVREARAAVGWWRECHGLPSHSEQPLVRRVCSTAAKHLTSANPLQRRDATLADMRALVDHFLYPKNGPVDLLHRMHVTGFILAFAGFLRMDELSHVLVHEAYLSVTEEGVTLVLRRSKTDAAQRGAQIFIPANTSAAGRRYCPVALTRALLAQGGYERRRTDVDCGPLMRHLHCSPAGHVLRPVYGSLLRPIASLPPTALSTTLRAMLRAAGRDATQLSGHSMRIGAATAAAQAGASLMEIQQRGRWASSSCAQRYVRGPLPLEVAPPRME